MDRQTTTTTTRSISLPCLLLHVEGLAVLIATIVLYAWTGGDWLAFALLLLVPDVSMLGYVAGPGVGSVVYNAVHTYVGPVALGLLALAGGWMTGVALALIWLAHIGMDRTVGYGLKYATGFKDTHISRL